MESSVNGEKFVLINCSCRGKIVGNKKIDSFSCMSTENHFAFLSKKLITLTLKSPALSGLMSDEECELLGALFKNQNWKYSKAETKTEKY